MSQEQYLAGVRDYRLAVILENACIYQDRIHEAAFPVGKMVNIPQFDEQLQKTRHPWTYDGVRRDVRAPIGGESRGFYENLTIPSGQISDDDGDATYFDTEYRLQNLETAIDNAQDRAFNAGIELMTFEHGAILAQELQYVGWRFDHQ